LRKKAFCEEETEEGVTGNAAKKAFKRSHEPKTKLWSKNSDRKSARSKKMVNLVVTGNMSRLWKVKSIGENREGCKDEENP